ncbi:MAG: penicillin acylase family protein [Cyclobacteriaceae bacterium]|jgi:acyl-homoserine-lactone acylase
MRVKICFLIAALYAPFVVAQLPDPTTIDIIRDKWGVPHIAAKTDAGVAYGLAWANAEDDFKTIQQGFLAGKAMLGLYSGKSGATVDFVVQFLQCRKIVDERYDKDIAPDYKLILESYAAGINAYANAHPHEVLLKNLFPVTPKDMLTYSVLQLAISSGADKALREITGGVVPLASNLAPGGSNGYAFNSKKTKDGNVYLAINSHQPLEGPVAWYEAHLMSEEGWNILGALFPGAPSILHGCNENLGWAHTVNNPDKLDVYQLEINPANENQYKLDDHWETLEETTIKLKVKVMGIPVTVKRKIWNSKFGPTLVTKKGTFAIRTGALMEIRALEQWYRMNKAKNFTEFKKALSMGAISGYNIIYADKYDTIYYISNGKIPVRKAGYDWNATVPGNTSQTLWNDFYPIDQLPQLVNPASGYLYNSNHSPFNATAEANNILASTYNDKAMGYETHDNNRSKRFMELIAQYPQVSYEDFKRIKYDLQLPQKLAYQTDANVLFQLSPNDLPDHQEVIQNLISWDRKATIESKGAAIFAIIYYQVVNEQAGGATYHTLTKQKCLELIAFAKKYMLENFGRANITLGEYQKLVRGDKRVSLPGLPDVIAAMHSVPDQHGTMRGNQGESYIELVKFTAAGPEIETIHCYGASNNPTSEHYADQMNLFVEQKTKPMTLNKEKVYQEAKRVYHPK